MIHIPNHNQEQIMLNTLETIFTDIMIAVVSALVISIILTILTKVFTSYNEVKVFRISYIVFIIIIYTILRVTSTS